MVNTVHFADFLAKILLLLCNDSRLSAIFFHHFLLILDPLHEQFFLFALVFFLHLGNLVQNILESLLFESQILKGWISEILCHDEIFAQFLFEVLDFVVESGLLIGYIDQFHTILSNLFFEVPPVHLFLLGGRKVAREEALHELAFFVSLLHGNWELASEVCDHLLVLLLRGWPITDVLNLDFS